MESLTKFTSQFADEGFFTTETEDEEKGKTLKRGRCSKKKNRVQVMTESIPVENGVVPKDGETRMVGHLKMFVIEDLKSETIDRIIAESVYKQSIIDSDNSKSYTNFKMLVKEHRPKVIHEKEVAKMLPWVHIAISNAKRMLLDIFHDIRPEYLQNYLNEFCSKFNRLYFGELLLIDLW